MADVATCILEAGYTAGEQIEMFGAADLTAEDIIKNIPEAQRKLEINRRARKISAIRMGTLVKRIQDAAEGGDVSYVRALKATLSRDLQDAIGGVSVEDLQHGVRARVNAAFDELAEELKPRRAGTKHNVTLERDIGIELRSRGSTKNPLAKRAADVVEEQLDFLRKLANRAGAAIPKLKGWGLPQSHDGSRIARDGREAWKAFILPRLDQSAMLDDLGRPLEPSRLNQLLDYVYETITTDGRNKVEPPSFARSYGASRVSQRRNQSRILHFKDGDSWWQYQQKYGNEDVWATITNHVNALSNDVGLMMAYGPDPDRSFEALDRWIRKIAPTDMISDLGGTADAIYQNVRGFDINDQNKMAEVFGNTRGFLSASQLGSALFPSLADAVLAELNAFYHGSGLGNVIKRLKTFGDEEMRRIATRSGNDLEYAMNHVAAQARYEDVSVGRFGRMLSDINYRLGLMTPWFNGMNQAWHLEFTSLLARNADRELGDLPKGIRRFLKNYDLEGDWDAIRSAGMIEHRGEKYLNATEMDNIDLSIKVLGAMNTEKRMAVITPSARNRAAMNWGFAPGTTPGEVMRSVGQYKNFPVTVVMNMVSRYMFGKNTGGLSSRMGYTMAMVAGMTTMGALAVQLKALSKGQDPRSMDDPDFWVLAFTTGGAAGILGDLLISGETRHGRGWLETALGPTGGLLADAGRVATSPFAEESEKQFVRSVEGISNYVPFNSLWYLRTPIERNLRNTLLAPLGSEYRRRQRDKERNLRRRTGQKYYWKYQNDLEDRALPQRAPDFGAAEVDKLAERITSTDYTGPLFD